LSQRRLTPTEVQYLRETMNADLRIGNIRLREGEYQYDLAKAIASFQLELYFPDVKNITRRLYGEDKTNDVQFIRKIQTILKKMEKSNIVRILPKKTPWELQRYALSSFKFQDSDRNLVIFATDEQIQRAQKLLQSVSIQQEAYATKLISVKGKIFLLAFMVVVSYMVILWDTTQNIVNPVVFVLAFSIAVVCSLMLGKLLSRE